MAAAFVELVNSSNGTTHGGMEYKGQLASGLKRKRSSDRGKGEKRNLTVVPSHFMRTDISGIKGETQIFSSLMFCILSKRWFSVASFSWWYDVTASLSWWKRVADL